MSNGGEAVVGKTTVVHVEEAVTYCSYVYLMGQAAIEAPKGPRVVTSYASVRAYARLRLTAPVIPVIAVSHELMVCA